MSEPRYHVILTGEIQPGQDRTAVAARLANLMKLPQEKAQALLQGKPNKVKSGVAESVGQKYHAALEKTGAVVILEAEITEPAAAEPLQPEPAEEATPAAEPALEPMADTAPQESTPYAAPADDHLHPDEVRYCTHCGGEAPRLARVCPHCKRKLPTLGRSREVAALLALLPTGAWGINRFYLGQWWGIFYLLFCWSGIPSLVSLVEFIVFLCTSRETWDEKHGHKSGSSAWVWVIVGLFLMIMIVGILAAIAIPAYQDYTLRAKVNQTLWEAEEVETEVEAFIQRTDFVPNSAIDMGWEEVGHFSYSSWVMTDNAVITITFDDSMQAIAGETLTLAPYLEDDQLVWDCTGGTVAPRYRPQECRP